MCRCDGVMQLYLLYNLSEMGQSLESPNGLCGVHNRDNLHPFFQYAIGSNILCAYKTYIRNFLVVMTPLREHLDFLHPNIQNRWVQED